MSMIKLEFPADRKDIALALGRALTEIGGARSCRVEYADTGKAPVFTAEDAAQLQGDPGAYAEMDEAHYTPGSDDVEYSEHVDEETGEITTGKSVSSAEVTGSSAGAKSSALADANTRLDENGVPYNAEFCANAAKPFYGSGKTKGQWKKRQGVDPTAYDAWYERELAMVELDTHEEDEAADAAEETRDYAAEQRAACAFGATGAQADTQTAPGAPASMGELMAWISERQAAGTMPPDAVATAFTTLGLPMDALLNPAGDIPGNCAKVWAALGGGK